MKLLFVEDEPQSVEPAITSLGEGADTKVMNFDEAIAGLVSYDPDIVVLDIVRDGASGEAEADGITVYEKIWKEKFCPVIVYSAHPERLSNIREEHPFVTFVKKGSKSISEFNDALTAFQPHVESIQETQCMVRRELSASLREIAPLVYDSYEDGERQQAIVRLSRRRIAAAMDESSLSEGTPLQSWEQYISPPISADIGLGDVLMLVDGTADDPESFRIVLSPSCDLVSSGGRKAKVEEVLLAKCSTIEDGMKALNMHEMGAKKKKERIPAILSTGYSDDVLPIPSLEGSIPAMVARLKKLELVKLEEISGEKARFRRIASIDSPFRELVSWAYLQTAGRPGLPDRDFKKWCEEMMTELEKNDGS